MLEVIILLLRMSQGEWGFWGAGGATYTHWAAYALWGHGGGALGEPSARWHRAEQHPQLSHPTQC